MIRTPFFLAAFAAVSVISAATAVAQSKIASVDMETVILSHPKDDENKTRLRKLMNGYEFELAPKREAAKKLADSLEEKVKLAGSQAVSEGMRMAAIEEARKIESELRKKEQELRESVGELQSKLAEEEHRLFEEMMESIKKSVDKIARAEKYDYVIDNSAYRFNPPIPVVMFANPASDITDKVIKDLGGTKVDKATAMETNRFAK